MIIRILFFLLAVGTSAYTAMAAELTLAEQICRSYTNIHTVSCMVRKTTELQGHTAKMLSRVYYQRPDRLHVENIVPLRRRILSDGTRFYLTQDGWRKGYSVPLPELTGEWKIMQQAIPGTAMEHLLRLHGVPEEVLEGLPDLPIRRAYQKDDLCIVLSADAQHRLARIEFYTSSDFAERTALYLFDDFLHVTNDCWLAARQRAELCIRGENIKETRRLDKLTANQPLAAGLFDPDAFFKGMEFVADFSAAP
ncbi:MAG: LolA family protein [Kiritimatiellia bacterium]|jgi:hypothetical protein